MLTDNGKLENATMITSLIAAGRLENITPLLSIMEHDKGLEILISSLGFWPIRIKTTKEELLTLYGYCVSDNQIFDYSFEDGKGSAEGIFDENEDFIVLLNFPKYKLNLGMRGVELITCLRSALYAIHDADSMFFDDE